MQPLVKWLKNDKEVLSGGRYLTNKAQKKVSCLTIMTVKEEDLGTFTCQFAKDQPDSKSSASAQIELTGVYCSFLTLINRSNLMIAITYLLSIRTSGIPVTPELLEVTYDSSKTPILKWKVKSFLPLTSYQVRVKKQEVIFEYFSVRNMDVASQLYILAEFFKLEKLRTGYLLGMYYEFEFEFSIPYSTDDIFSKRK